LALMVAHFGAHGRVLGAPDRVLGAHGIEGLTKFRRTLPSMRFFSFGFRI